MNLEEHLKRQIAFSRATFGPGERTAGVSDHIRKELDEVAKADSPRERVREWVDVVILALDGLTRACVADRIAEGFHMTEMLTIDAAYDAARGIAEKQGANEWRSWPDWRTADPNKAIEHVRTEGE